ncbi:MAG: hypothetical protein WDO18_14710 [Acidobacteriota bacterium]
MRFGRIILLASLAQLLGLSALAAALSEQPASIRDVQMDQDHPVWQLLPIAIEPVFQSAPQPRPLSWTVFALNTLASTPLRRAVWMVAPAVRTTEVPRPRQSCCCAAEPALLSHFVSLLCPL